MTDQPERPLTFGELRDRINTMGELPDDAPVWLRYPGADETASPIDVEPLDRNLGGPALQIIIQ